MKKRLLLVLGATMIFGCLTACGKDNEKTADSTVAIESTETTEVVTYEFETFDGDAVVINENNIVSQEACDNPSEWTGLPVDAEQLAPGRDCILFADSTNYYVEDLTNNLVTVATKEAAEGESEIAGNPGAFDTDSWSISYDTEKWYGYEDNGSVIINNLNAVAGSSYIEITEVDVATVDEAIAMIQDTKGKKLTAPEKTEMNGSECYIAYDEPIESEEGGVAIFDFYIIFEYNGKVIVINESITEDPDESRAEALSYEFDDVISTFVLK